MMTRILRAAAALAAVVLATATPAADETQVPYPEGYRYWPHIKSMVIQQGHPLFASFGGIHHIYANEKALAAFQARKGFPDDAVIVFDLLEATTADNAINEGRRKVVAVMHKDRKRFAATGGWGFEAFTGGSHSQRTVGAKAAEACFGCHAPQKPRDYVFSRYRM